MKRIEYDESNPPQISPETPEEAARPHRPIDETPDIPAQTGVVDTETLTRDLESAIDIAMRGKLRRLAAANGTSLRRAVPLLLSELVR